MQKLKDRLNLAQA